MIVRYEVGFTDKGWYQNTDAFHHLRDAIDAARALVSETIPLLMSASPSSTSAPKKST